MGEERLLSFPVLGWLYSWSSTDEERAPRASQSPHPTTIERLVAEGTENGRDRAFLISVLEFDQCAGVPYSMPTQPEPLNHSLS